MTSKMHRPSDERLLDAPRHDAGLRVRVLVGSLLVVGLAACSASPAATGGPSTAGGSSLSPVAPTPGVTATGSRSTPSPASSAALSARDPAGDVTPTFLDITRLGVDANATSLLLSLDLAAEVPPGSPNVGSLAYEFALDIDGDGTADQTVTLAQLPGGGFSPTLTDARTGARLTGPSFPGTADLGGRAISMTVTLTALGCPPVIGVRATSRQTKAGVTVTDQAPDPAGSWVSVTTGCSPASSKAP